MPEQPRQEEWSPQPRTPDPKHVRRRRLSRLTVIAGIVILALCGWLAWFLVPHASGGPFTAFPLPAGSSLESITTGPDGNLWFTENDGKIGRITTNGTLTEFPLPIYSNNPRGITAGPDGNLWFTETGANKIGASRLAG